MSSSDILHVRDTRFTGFGLSFKTIQYIQVQRRYSTSTRLLEAAKEYIQLVREK